MLNLGLSRLRPYSQPGAFLCSILNLHLKRIFNYIYNYIFFPNSWGFMLKYILMQPTCKTLDPKAWTPQFPGSATYWEFYFKINYNPVYIKLWTSRDWTPDYQGLVFKLFPPMFNFGPTRAWDPRLLLTIWVNNKKVN